MGRRFLRLLVLIVFAVGLLAGTGTVQAQDSSWVGEYFNNAALSGEPVLVRADAAIDFVWGDSAPDPALLADRFSVRWTRAVNFTGGTYRFTARTDDGVRIYVDNRLVLDAWYDHAPDPALTAEVDIPAGQHVIRVEYYENSGAALAEVSWAAVSGLGVGTWVAEYYNNANLTGPPVLEQTEAVIDYNWSYSTPVPGRTPVDYFSARWTGSPYFEAGTYQFTIYADDGVRLWVDNTLVIDEWQGSGFEPPYTVTVSLGEGLHAVRIEYYEATEVAAIRVGWALVGAPAPTATPTPAPLPTTGGAWNAEYFNNTALSGAVVYTEQLAGLALDVDWEAGSPAAVVAADNFSARFSREVTFLDAPLRFVVRADDGVRLYIDGSLVLNEWHTASGDYYFIDQRLTPGAHTLTLELYEADGLASLRCYWVYPRPAGAETGVTARVETPLLNVRSGPGVSYPVIGRMEAGSVVAVTGVAETLSYWVRVNYGTYEGWINSAYTTLFGDTALLPVVTASESAAAYSFGAATGLRLQATANLNVRSGPGITYAIVGWLVNGGEADVVGRSADGAWYEINFARGRGWVSSGYVTLLGDTSAAVPVTG